MAYSFSNNCIKNYWNQTTTVKIIVESWVVYFFATRCIVIIMIVTWITL